MWGYKNRQTNYLSINRDSKKEIKPAGEIAETKKMVLMK